MRIVCLFILVLSVSGCQTASNTNQSRQSRQEAQEALSAVAEALSGQELSEEELRDLEKQIRTDEEAQSAVQAITDSMAQTPVVKYCPVDGQRYAPHLEECPEHTVPLEIVEP